MLKIDNYLDYISNRVIPNLSLDLRKALEALWSSSTVPGIEKA
jgi:hypothetical protein